MTDELSRPGTYVALPWRCEMSTVSQYGMRHAYFALSMNFPLSNGQLSEGAALRTTSELASGFRWKLPLEIIAILPGNFRRITRRTCICPIPLHQASQYEVPENTRSFAHLMLNFGTKWSGSRGCVCVCHFSFFMPGRTSFWPIHGLVECASADPY